jgi:hypothetical protein
MGAVQFGALAINDRQWNHDSVVTPSFDLYIFKVRRVAVLPGGTEMCIGGRLLHRIVGQYPRPFCPCWFSHVQSCRP